VTLTMRPLRLAEANAVVSEWHRHHKPVRQCIFAVGAFEQGGGSPAWQSSNGPRRLHWGTA
jgi:hypothetical protein